MNPEQLKQFLTIYITLLNAGKIQDAEKYLNSSGLNQSDRAKVRTAAFEVNSGLGDPKKAAFESAGGVAAGSRGLSESGRRLTPTQLAKLRKAPENLQAQIGAAERFLEKNLGPTAAQSAKGAETFLRENLDIGLGNFFRPYKGNVPLGTLKQLPADALKKIGGADDAFKTITSKNINLPGKLPTIGRKTKLAAGGTAALAAGTGYNYAKGDKKKAKVQDYTKASAEDKAAMDAGLEQAKALLGAFTGVFSDAEKNVATSNRNARFVNTFGQRVNRAELEELIAQGVDPLDALEYLEDAGGGDGGAGAGLALGYAQLAENQRQFDIEQQLAREQFEEGTRQFTISKATQDNQFVMDQMRGMEEFAKNYAVQLEQLGLSKQQIQQAAQQFAQSFAENQRQFNVTEAREGKQFEASQKMAQAGLNETIRANKAREADVARTRALEEQKHIAEILRNPSDFLARAFSSRGAVSPQATITQADLINNLKSGVDNALRGYAQGGATQEGKFVTGEQGREMILNPTNAPIIVLNNDQTKQMEQGHESNYASGTGFKPGLLDILGRFTPAGTRFSPTNFAGGARYTTPEGQQGLVGLTKTGEAGMYNANAGQVTDLEGSQYYENLNEEGMPYEGYSGMGGTDPMQDALKRKQESDALQAMLVSLVRTNSPPAVTAALEGTRIPDARPIGQLTPGRIQKLTPGELQALNTRLGVEFNSDLQTELGLLNSRFGSVVSRRRGRLAV